MMWLLRRAALPLKLHGPWLEASRVISAKSDILSSSVSHTVGSCRVEKEHCFALSAGERLFLGNCGYCSGASAIRENRNDVLADSELQISPTAELAEERNGDKEELLSEMELSEGDDEKGASSEDIEMIDTALVLLNSIRGGSSYCLFDICDTWAKKGNKLSIGGVSIIFSTLHNRHMYWKALKFSEWLRKSKHIELTEKYYAVHLSCISQTQTLEKVEMFFEEIPESFKGELVYRNLLRSCVHFSNRMKAEAVFKKMKDLDIPITVDDYNQLILLYKNLDKKKIVDILLTMQKQNVKPSLLTYKLLVDAKGKTGDIMGMERVFEAMKVDGVEPDPRILASMAEFYIASGFKSKAETILKEIEEMKGDAVWARKLLLPLYASLGRDDKVRKIWIDCESEPTIFECLAAIEAWGKLGEIEDAEAVFDVLRQKCKISGFHYSTLLNVYVNNKLLTKANDLVKQMSDSGCSIGPKTWDALVRLCIESGEVEKADSILNRAGSQSKARPMSLTYMAVMSEYAKRGDVFNTEKLFQRIRQCGYVIGNNVFALLAQAYVNAETPAFGFRDRMKAYNLFPNEALAKQLVQVDAFRKNSASDLLD
ncbi:pentatricopeptide repeat-containing protein At1g80270, mitochondrial-like [Euphorbia lathyris]|uniref:pentatricopeptide repeat-containing protein At1g80270, mitochondrial-like n=1 Tax=Euphorbia lathyris TaxID=212925 RepID=UPI0033143DEA